MKLLTNAKVFTHNTVKKTGIIIDEKGPKWAILSGAALLVASTVVACKQTTKAETIIDEHKRREEAIHTAATDEIYKDQYTEEDEKKDIQTNYIKTGIAFLKLYRVPIVMTAVGLASILWGTNRLDKKVRDLTISAAAVTEALNQYRQRVANAIGEDKERDLYLNTREVVETDKDGNVTKAEKVLNEEDRKSNPSIFEFGPINWDGSVNVEFDRKTPSYNLLTIRNVQQSLQRDLEIYGTAYVRDGFKRLGIPCPALYLTAGWHVERNEDGELYAPIGDAKVDFGLIDDIRFYCDEYDLAEEDAGIAEAKPIMFMPNCRDIRAYLYNKERKKYN